VATEERDSDKAALLLMCLNRLDKVAAKLEEQRQAGELDEQTKPLLFRLDAATGKRPEAAALALDEFWKQPQPLAAGSPWYRLLAGLTGDGGAAIAPSAARPADAALLTLLTRGPAAGLKAFATLAAQEPPTLEAMRGLVFAAELAGDNTAALQANDK